MLGRIGTVLQMFQKELTGITGIYDINRVRKQRGELVHDQTRINLFLFSLTYVNSVNERCQWITIKSDYKEET